MAIKNEVKEESKESFWDQFIKKALRNGREFNPKRVALRITVIYVIVGILWILLSDRVLGMFAFDKEMLIMISLLKGWIYVIVTGLLVLGLIYSALKQIRVDVQKLTAAYEELENAHELITASEEELRQQFDTLIESQKQLTESEEQLHHMAYHDMLTGLPGRLALYEDLSAIFARNNVTCGALFFIDLDDFKFINDSLGHSFGDQLIKEMGERLAEMMKEIGTVYRLGGDEYVIFSVNIREQEEAGVLASRILSEFKEPFKVDESILHINISIGVSLYPEHGKDINELLRCADIAMYRAKKVGKNRFMVYSHPMNDMVAERVMIEKYLHTALENNEFELYYQPQFNITENRISGLEALLRWNSKELGFVSPLKFIKIAEETQLIMPLGEWVLKKACSFIKDLHTRGHTDITISVNISILQLLQNNFEDMVLGILEFYSLNPQCLELEITESVLMESYEAIEGKLKNLCSKGIKIALDDFGKGYSSLSYLKQLPISTLKIDKSFIDGISSEEENKLLTGQIVMMGRSMGLCVIAEGVETQEQVDYLMKYKCHKIQGFLFYKPLPEKKVKALLAR